MNFDPTHNYVAEHQHGFAFFPWAFLNVLGSLWAFEVPTVKSISSLSRQVRVYHFASYILLLVAVPLGTWLKLVWPCVAVSVIVPLVVYSIFIHRRMTTLVRIPLRHSVAIFAVKLGAVRLWQNVFLGVLCAVFAVLFSSTDFGVIAITTGFAVNAVVAFYALQFVTT
jgi:hypothetical protein